VFGVDILDYVLGTLEKDYPEEFKDRINIRKLSEAIDEQLQEVSDVIKELHQYRTLYGGYPPEENDTGYRDRQLDLAGDNVVMSRAQAGVVSSPNQSMTSDAVMKNEDYTKFLQYKAYKNSSECTYFDLMTMLEIISGATDIEYREDLANPATIYVKPNSWSIDFPPVSPAGVGFIVEREKKGSLTMYAGVGNVLKKTFKNTFSAEV
jgi:hypothetical protein